MHRRDALQNVIEYIRRYPGAVLAGGDGALLLQELERLHRELSITRAARDEALNKLIQITRVLLPDEYQDSSLNRDFNRGLNREEIYDV